MQKLTILTAFALITSCTQTPIPNPMDYVSSSSQQSAPITSRHFDVGHYQANDTFRLPNGNAILSWSYSPWGAFNASNGDGGEEYALNNGVVAILGTQDGSSPNITTFGGPDHWVVFKNDATNTPKCFIAQVGANQAYTCYWRATINYPVLGNVDSIVSEHYYTSDPVTAPGMERGFYGLNTGRIVWQSWNPTALPTRSDIDTRCLDFGYNAPPQPNWVLNDCREAVYGESADGSLTFSELWPGL